MKRTKMRPYKFLATVRYEDTDCNPPILKIVLPKKNPIFVHNEYKVTLEER